MNTISIDFRGLEIPPYETELDRWNAITVAMGSGELRKAHYRAIYKRSGEVVVSTDKTLAEYQAMFSATGFSKRLPNQPKISLLSGGPAGGMSSV